jgi:acyl-CoA thioester hydrolase
MAKRALNEPKLKDTALVKVRFSEVDSMQIVWHGEYVRYFEDGREAFGLKYPGLGYMDIYNSGFTAPMVDMTLQYKRSLRYGDSVLVETRFIDSKAAKICFEYILRRQSDGEIVATGTTIQVFCDPEGNLLLVSPDFFIKWKERWGIL